MSSIRDQLHGHVLLWHDTSCDNKVRAGLFSQLYRYKVRVRVLEWDFNTSSPVSKNIITVPYALIFDRYLPEHETLHKCAAKECITYAPAWAMSNRSAYCSSHSQTIWTLSNMRSKLSASPIANTISYVNYANAYARKFAPPPKTSHIMTADGEMYIDLSHLRIDDVLHRIGVQAQSVTKYQP